MPNAEILLYRVNGTVDPTDAGSDDTARGTNLVTVLNSANGGDTVVVPPGGYKLASGETATRDAVHLHLMAGVRIWKDGKEPGAVVSVTGGKHTISGFGRIENAGTFRSTKSRGIEVKGGELLCSADTVVSTADLSSAVVSEGSGDITLRAREIRAIVYDGVELGGNGQCVIESQLAVTDGGSDGNAIEENASDAVGKRDIHILRASSNGGPALNLQNNGRSVVRCAQVTSNTGHAILVNTGVKIVNVGFATNFGAIPTLMLNSTFGQVRANVLEHDGSSHVAEVISFRTRLSANCLLNRNSSTSSGGCIKVTKLSGPVGNQPIVDAGAIGVSASGAPAMFAAEPVSVYVIRNYRSAAANDTNITVLSQNHT